MNNIINTNKKILYCFFAGGKKEALQDYDIWELGKSTKVILSVKGSVEHAVIVIIEFRCWEQETGRGGCYIQERGMFCNGKGGCYVGKGGGVLFSGKEGDMGNVSQDMWG